MGPFREYKTISIESFPTLANARKYSTEKLSQLREALAKLSLPSTIAIVTTGSFARLEATEHSDLDFFLLIENKGMMVDRQYIDDIKRTIVGIVRRTVGKEPSVDGAFGVWESIDRMLINIGGNADENTKITRRILLLLECDWLSNQKLFDSTRSRLLTRYLDNKIPQSHIARFLLNDIIRYYRTVCVDFEYKTFEARKDYGIRNVKLRFPRKLLYFSGLLVTAQTAGELDKKAVLEELIKMTPIDRLRLQGSADSILKEYELYLSKLSDGDNRRTLENIQSRDEGVCELFDELRTASHRMSLAMKKRFEESYKSDHPIYLGVFN